MTISLEDAIKCPKCGEPGVEVSTQNLGRKGIAHVYHCDNKLCLWYQTGYVVQEHPDGSIHENSNRSPSLYPALTPSQEAMARRVIEDLDDQ